MIFVYVACQRSPGLKYPRYMIKLIPHYIMSMSLFLTHFHTSTSAQVRTNHLLSTPLFFSHAIRWPPHCVPLSPAAISWYFLWKSPRDNEASEDLLLADQQQKTVQQTAVATAFTLTCCYCGGNGETQTKSKKISKLSMFWILIWKGRTFFLNCQMTDIKRTDGMGSSSPPAGLVS